MELRKNQKFDSQEDRILYFDYLRVFATIAVMVLHISAQNWHVADVNGFEWQTFNFFNSIVRWCVPVFVMISGALFLERDIPFSKLYSKYILRMAVAFAAWSFIYALFMDGTAVIRIFAWIQGHYHMWFILMIIGLYACIPLIKPIVANDDRIRYYLVLAVLFAFAVPELLTLANDFGNELIIKGATAIGRDADNMNMHIVFGYASYFVLGYYINKIDLTKCWRILIYILGAIGAVATIVLDLAVALKTQTCCDHYYGNYNVNVLFQAVAVFVWFKYRAYSNRKLNMFIQKLSKYCFGAYLVHALVLERLNDQMGLNSLSFHPVFSIICITVIVFTISFAISAVLNCIPVIKKYMV